MPQSVQVVLPDDLADDLIAAGFAVHPRVTKGAELVEAVTLAIDAVNTGGAVVTLVIGVQSLTRLVTGLVKRRRPAGDTPFTVRVTGRGRDASLKIDPADPRAAGTAVEFLIEFFNS